MLMVKGSGLTAILNFPARIFLSETRLRALNATFEENGLSTAECGSGKGRPFSSSGDSVIRNVCSLTWLITSSPGRPVDVGAEAERLVTEAHANAQRNRNLTAENAKSAESRRKAPI